MDTGTMVYLGLGLSLVASLGVFILYQNVKKPKVVKPTPTTKPKKRRK